MIKNEVQGPDFKEGEIIPLVKNLYGLKVSAERLDSYSDQNFRLRDESGKEYVLKISHPAEKKETLEMQNKAIEYLSSKFDHLRFPQVVRAMSGETVASVENAKGQRLYIRLLTHLEGQLLSQLKPQPPEIFYLLGRFMAEMDRALANFYHPAACRELPWDLKNALHSRERLSFTENPHQRRLVEYFLLQFETCVIPVLPKLRSSIIHNDFNDNNILVEKLPGGGEKIVGIIDFGDMVHAPTICELAVALTYAMLGKDNPLQTASLLIRGYHKVHPLEEEEIDILYYLICARLSISVTMSAWRKRVEPDNEYITISEKPAWSMLEKLLEINPELARRTFRLACGMPFSPRGMSRSEILRKRKSYISQSLSISYKRPLKIIRGAMQYLYDDKGKTYLDCVNNVCHVGHCHPKVVKAAQEQMSILNTNTRYLHENLVRYAERLCSGMPEPLKVCFIVNSGSEANDLALRLARAYTGQKDIIVVDGAYHGHLTSLIEISPYKFDGPGGGGAPAHVHKVMTPDVYRGPYKAEDLEAGKKYAHGVAEVIAKIQSQGKNIAAFICESLMGCAGQIVFPENYLKNAFAHVRKAGGLCIADEVQVGFGRLGSHFWGFETQGVIPDIVTLGKPIGNGHPLAAVVTTPEIADAFCPGMEYFNTFGGNPVSCGVGMAVLDVLEEEKLQQNALRVGALLKEGLESLKVKHELLGDIRGMGLFLGVELVEDRQTLRPAAQQAREIIEKMKDKGVLLSIDGPLRNVLKIKPPLVFNEANAELFVTSFDKVLDKIK